MSSTDAMDASAYLPGSEQLPPPIDEPKLVQPKNVKSRYWVHFMRYDLEFHPDKKTTARCNLCDKEISVKQGTGGLKNHLKFKHPEESSALMDNDEVSHATTTPTPVLHPPKRFKAEGTPSRGGTATVLVQDKKRPSQENTYTNIKLRMDAEKRSSEKHLMEMWSLTRKELGQIRQELKGEEDEEVIKELEDDVRVLKKRKADYAEMLGFPKDDIVAEGV
ncbi:hypothetical protein ACHAXR_010071 [Thalassiosira sp. AJA248-18]